MAKGGGGRGSGNGGGWPSTTGRPSGGGRSNAPARSGRGGVSGAIGGGGGGGGGSSDTPDEWVELARKDLDKKVEQTHAAARKIRAARAELDLPGASAVEEQVKQGLSPRQLVNLKRLLSK